MVKGKRIGHCAEIAMASYFVCLISGNNLRPISIISGGFQRRAVTLLRPGSGMHHHSPGRQRTVLQYLTRSALSRVESRHIRVFRLFTFPAFLSKTRQYTQDFIVPSNFHHNLDTLENRRRYTVLVCAITLLYSMSSFPDFFTSVRKSTLHLIAGIDFIRVAEMMKHWAAAALCSKCLECNTVVIG